MSRYLIPTLGILIAVSLIMFDLTILRSGRTALRPTLQKGVALGLYQASKGMSHYKPSLDAIAQIGATHLSIPVYYFQDAVTSAALYSKPTDGATPQQHDKVVKEVIEYAHRLGMKVLLAPIVDIENPVGKEWRGQIAPQDWSIWFDSYRAFIGHYARIAEAYDVEFMSVGTELVSSEHQTEQWRETIRGVRSVYHGQLTYSANWDQYDVVAFWDDLDFLGVSGYFELVPFQGASVEDLLRGWSHIKPRLLEWQARWNKPLLFTEIGYYSRVGAGSEPWNYVAETPLDLEEQYRCFTALKASWENEPGFAGLYIWNVEPNKAGPSDNGYSFLGKPAEQVLRAWYGGIPADAGILDILVNTVERFFRAL